MLAELYETIFVRKSVRKFEPSPLASEAIAELSAFMKELVPMHDDITIEPRIVPGKDVMSPFRPKPSNYILAFSEPKDGYLVNAGFMLQQVDLFLSVRDIGCCWQGIPQPTWTARKSSKLEFIIALAIGMPAEPIHRSSAEEFDRKPIEQITTISEMDDIMEAVRLAPSATNNQPWFFTRDEAGLLHAYCVKVNPLKAIFFHKFNEISLGIAICHAWIAMLHEGKTPEFTNDASARDHPPAGYYYVTSIKFS